MGLPGGAEAAGGRGCAEEGEHPDQVANVGNRHLNTCKRSRKSSGVILALRQEASRGGQGGPEAGPGEGSDDPGAGPVCATVPVQNQPTGDRTTPV